jgi:M6 family metalloprotease-like protein
MARALPDTIRALAIRVDFEDHPMDSSTVYFERVLLFMNQYWNQVTYGQITIQTTLTESIYRLPQEEIYYGDDEFFAERQTLFIRDAILAADPDLNLAAYDAHLCIHAGNGQEADAAGDSPEQIYSIFAPLEVLQYYLPDSTRDRGILTNDLTAEGDPYYVQFAIVLPEVESQDYYPNTDIPYIFGMLGVYAHEFGHALGLPDLYDTTPEEFPDSQGIGIFDVMSHGTWNNAGFAPARPSAWSLFDLGCLDVQVITQPGRFELPAVHDSLSRRVAAIPLGGDEYFLLENRVLDPNGNGSFDFNNVNGDTLFDFYIDDYAGAEFDFFLFDPRTETCSSQSGGGLYIWHIDPSVIEANFSSNSVVGEAAHKGIDLEEADGVEDLDGLPASWCAWGAPDDAFFAGNRVRFGPETIPSTLSSYGVPTFVTVDSVSAPGPLMSFVVGLDRRKGGLWPVTLAGPVGGNHPTAAELTGKGAGLETVVVDTTGGVWVIAGDGNQPLGSPLGQVGPDANTTPAIGDVDGDGLPEVVVAGADGTLYAWNGEDGSEVLDGDANPATVGVWARVGRSLRDAIPVLAPARSGIGHTVVIGSPEDSTGMGAIFLCEQSGSSVTVTSAEVRGDATAPPLVFFDAAQAAPVVLAAVVDGSRTCFAVASWAALPVEATCIAEQDDAVRALVAGDLDGDGFYEVIASNHNGKIQAYSTSVPRAGGSFSLDALRPVAGWPFDLGVDAAHDLALADIDADGRVEVLVSALDGRLFAVNFNGTPQLFFPETVSTPNRPVPRLVPSPLAIDLGGGTTSEVIFAPGDGSAFAVDGEGHMLDGWPLPGPAAKGVVPVIANIDQDGAGLLDLVVPSDFGSGSVIMAYELGVPEGPGSAWSGYRGGPERSGIFDAPPQTPVAQSFLREVFVYPNPVAGDDAIIHFSLGADADVELEILDAVGRVVAKPAAARPALGRTDHEVRWDVRDAASGVYLLRLVAKGQGQEIVELRPFAVTR